MDTADERTGLTALHIAVGSGNLPLVRYLIEERGARFVPDKWGPPLAYGRCRRMPGQRRERDYLVEVEAAAIAQSDRA